MNEARALRVDWRAALLAGVIAGAVFIAVEMIMVPLFLGMPPWAPVRMMAAILLGPGVLPPPATFDAGVFAAAMFVHFALSIVFALVVAAIVHRWETGTAVVAGLVFGLALYVVNFYGFTALFPWFAEARNWVNIVAHLVFGGVAAWAYKALERPASLTGGVTEARPEVGRQRPAAD